MKLNPQHIDQHLKQGLAPVYLIGGDEPLQLQEVCDAIRQTARGQGFTEREVLTVGRGFAWEELAQVAASMSLFGDKKIIELRLPGGKPGEVGAKVLREYAAQVTDDILLMVICDKLDSASLRTQWVQALEQAGVLLQVWPVEPARLPAWVQARMQANGLNASAEAVSMLVDRVEGNLLAAVQEIDKLVLLQGPGRIDVEAVADAVADSARYSIYTLVDTALSGRQDKTSRIINGLRSEGVEPVLLLWAISREIRSLSSMAAAIRQGQSLESVLSQYRVWERRKPLLREALKRHGLGRWYAMLQHCAKIDRMIKGIDLGQVWDELLQLGLSIAGTTVLDRT